VGLHFPISVNLDVINKYQQPSTLRQNQVFAGLLLASHFTEFIQNLRHHNERATGGRIQIYCSLIRVSIVIARPSHALLKHPNSFVTAVVLIHANKKAFV
jgi:hypothetical protein